MIFNLFNTGDGFFKSCRNLYKFSSFNLSDSYAVILQKQNTLLTVYNFWKAGFNFFAILKGSELKYLFSLVVPV